MPATIRGAIRWRLHFLFVSTLLFCYGCGYIWYYAHYVPYETYNARSELSIRDLQRAEFYKLGEGLGDLEVTAGFRLAFTTSSSFIADMWFARDSSISNSDSLHSTSRPVADSVVIICEETGYISTLVFDQINSDEYNWSFSSGPIHIGRGHDKLVLSFFARLVDQDERTIESKEFDVRLHRWEERNWMGRD